MATRRRLLTLAETAAATRIPARTLRRWVAEGRLVRHGTARRITLAPLEVAQLAQLRGQSPSGRRLRSPQK